jgi:hypothetical protein
MKITIQPFNIYKNFINSNIDDLIGAQVIYPSFLQTALISSFHDSETFSLKKFFFKIQNVCLFPKYTHEEFGVIFVSDQFYNQYFSNNHDLILDIIYDIPIVKMIKLQKLYGEYPLDDSLESILTSYFESSSIVIREQILTFDFLNIAFMINEISYTSEEVKDVKLRIEEMNLTVQFNEHFTVNKLKYDECETKIINYQWLQDLVIYGYVADQVIEIDFVQDLGQDLGQDLEEKSQEYNSFGEKINNPDNIDSDELDNSDLMALLNQNNLVESSQSNLVEPSQSNLVESSQSNLVESSQSNSEDIKTVDEIRNLRMAYYDKK